MAMPLMPLILVLKKKKKSINVNHRVPFDLSLYLVTDSTPAILKDRDICDVVEQALKGG